MSKKLLTVKEITAILSISRTKVYALIKSGELPFIRIGRCIRIPNNLFEDWLANQTAFNK